MNKKLVSIIAPVYNEETSIEPFVERVLTTIRELESAYNFEIILVDDGSRDRSLEKMKQFILGETRLRVIELYRNYGQTAAIQAGLDASAGEIVITMDADLQHFPEEIPIFLEKIETGYDMVCGWRKERVENIMRRWPSRAANYLIKRISGLMIHDFGTTYRAYRADLVHEMNLFGEFHRFIPALGSILGGKICEIPIKNVERSSGKSSYGIGRTFGVFFDLLLLNFFTRYMDRPLRLFGKIAFFTFGVGFAILAVLVAYAYIYNVHAVVERQGWFIMSVLLMVAAGQTLLTGIIAEILVRVYFSQENRRIYRKRFEWNTETVGQ